MSRGGWSGRGEYKRGNIHHDDRCRTEIDGQPKPSGFAIVPSARASAPIDT
jgi:hypothetical protein